jgi:tRNA threonylcarbamoyladenosine biosynthesis protein TsaB
MEKILHIETATDICSVALSDGNEILAVLETAIGKSHAGVLTVFIDEIFQETKIVTTSLNAISVSMGPGSYTGLRIGVSVAKGLSYGLNLPLIAVPTLEAMFHGMKRILELKMDYSDLPDIFIPMIDARRMEVYMTIYDKNGNQLESIKALIVDQDSFNTYLNDKKVCFFGNGASKMENIVVHNNAIYINDFNLSSSDLVSLALNRYRNNIFEDVAYFEPFYLKEFLTTTPKKNIFIGSKIGHSFC